MRIIMLTGHYVDRTHGGVESHVMYLGEALTEMGHEVLVVRPSTGESVTPPPQTPAFMHVEPTGLSGRLQAVSPPLPGRLLREYWSRLATNASSGAADHVLARMRPDVVHHHDFVENLRLARSVARRSGAPLVWTNHLGETLLLQRYAFGRFFLRWLTRRFALGIAPSQELMDALGASRRRMYCPNGVDTRRFRPLPSPERATYRQERGLDRKFVVLVPRRWAPTKGVLFLAEALRGVSLDRVHVILVGSRTPGYEAYGQDVERALADWRVPFDVVPSVAPGDMPFYYQISDLTVLPSVLEATSLAALEAMASGCLVVATKVGGLPEIIRHGSTGLLCEPEDAPALLSAIRTAMDLPPATRDAIVRSARQFAVEKYSWETIARGVVRQYEAVLEATA